MMERVPKLDLNITNRCNYRCAHCAFASGETMIAELPLARLEQILDETRALGGRKIDITGGEPTVREEYIDILRAAKRRGFAVELVTNGSTLDSVRLAELKAEGLDAIAVSLDGATYEGYSRVRLVGRSAYERARQTIEEAVALGLRTKINTLVCAETLDEIPGIIAYAKTIGVAELGLYYFTPVGRGARTELTPVEPLRWLSTIRERLAPLSTGLKVSLEVPLLEKEMLDTIGKPYRCVSIEGQNHLQILPDGKTYPCAILASYGRPVGDLAHEHVHGLTQEHRWSGYWRSIEPCFRHGSCVDFSSFDIGSYDGRYAPVCPLRKFTIDEICEGSEEERCAAA